MWKSIKKLMVATRTDDEFHATAYNEFATGERRSGLWAKAIVKAGGDATKAEAIYLGLLIQRLKDEAFLNQRDDEHQNPTVGHSDVAAKKVGNVTTEDVNNKLRLHAHELCSDLRHKQIDLGSYALLAEEAGGRIEARGLFVESYVYIKDNKITKLGKLEQMRPWFIEHIIPLIENEP